MVAIVILPGMDGTGVLLAEFINALGTKFSVTVVTYPTNRPLGYQDLESVARAALPTERSFVLIGESFSGPIAISIAASSPPGLLGLVLCASFARNPLPHLRAFAQLTKFAPVSVVPTLLLSWLLLGRWSTPRLQKALQSAISHVTPAVLRARAAAALRVNFTARLASVRVPTLYLRASNDRLIPSSVARRVQKTLPSAIVSEVTGPHFLFQVAPQACARIVQQFVGNLA
jgi:pimeloyl-ACP methyl ester carboxylesterase